MPLSALLAQGKKFVSNGSDARRHARVRENVAAQMKASGLEVELGPQNTGTAGLVPVDLSEPLRRQTGLLQLGLQDSGDALLSHLGSGDHQSVRFETSAIHTSFHDTFLACRDRGVALHRNFLALGVYLPYLCEALDLEFDMRGAFDRSVSAGHARSRA